MDLLVFILEFIVFCGQLIGAWRRTLMFIVGISLAAIILSFWTGLISLILAPVLFVGCWIRGHYWHKAAERRLGPA